MYSYKIFRIIVPFAFGEPNTLTITAFWNEDYRTSPLWMFMKKGASLPTSKTFDKQLVPIIYIYFLSRESISKCKIE